MSIKPIAIFHHKLEPNGRSECKKSDTDQIPVRSAGYLSVITPIAKLAEAGLT
jgi:hypothetical protein